MSSSRIWMATRWRKAALVNGLKDAAAYRMDLLIQVLAYAIVPAALQLIFWNALFRPGVSTVGGMTQTDLIHYTIASLLFTQVRGGDHDFELAEMIRIGTLSNYLLRPVSVIEFIYLRGVSTRLTIALVCLVAGLGVEVYLGNPPWLMVGGMFLALVGNVIHYQIGACLASLSFLWEESYYLLMIKNLLVGLLAGDLLPLNLFPPTAQQILSYLPFHLYVYAPAQVALGRLDGLSYLRELGLGALWIVGGVIGIRLCWSAGLRRYASLGG